jgi:hypothetical protein
VAALRFHGHFNLEPLTSNANCPWLLVNPDALARLRFIVNLEQWRFMGTLRRPTAPNDDLLLYERK